VSRPDKLDEAPRPFSLDILVANLALDVKFSDIVLAFVGNENQVDALGQGHVRAENQLTAVGWECLVFSGSLHHYIEDVVDLVLELESGLVKLEHLTVDVDMVFGCPVNFLVLGAKTFLNDNSKSVAFFSDALDCSEVELHAVVVMSSELVRGHQAFIFTALVLLALESVGERRQRNSSSLPSFEVGRNVLGEWSHPVA